MFQPKISPVVKKVKEISGDFPAGHQKDFRILALTSVWIG
jgi:hypothetical protein